MEHGRIGIGRREGATQLHLTFADMRSKIAHNPGSLSPRHRSTWCSTFCREKDNHLDALDDVNMTDGGRKKRRMGCDGRTKREKGREGEGVE